MAKEKRPSCTFEELQQLGTKAVKIGDVEIAQVVPKVFSTGSYGLGFAGPVALQLPDGAVAECQVSINITVKHSKPAA